MNQRDLDLTDKRLVDQHGLAAVLSVNSETVKRMHRDGVIPGYLVGKNRVRFDVAECLARLRVEPARSAEGCHA